jgi:ABC-type protease/lipase transport system fused ATPase/permease subunit
MCLMCLYIHVRVLIHVIVLMFTIISCCVSAHFTINNDIVMHMSPDQADQMFLV